LEKKIGEERGGSDPKIAAKWPHIKKAAKDNPGASVKKGSVTRQNGEKGGRENILGSKCLSNGEKRKPTD